jgi:formate-dependent nitrite reductase membrane component NrfD
MLLERANEPHWTWLVYLEMFFAGIAAGAYVAATLLELSGRGRSPAARTAHLIAFPLMALAGSFLIFDLARPERFWHMIVQSERFLPMLKPWSPMSMGSWLLLLFSGVTFVSFVDALIARRVFRLGGWGYDHTLHGGLLGVAWSVLGAVLAFGVGIYSAVLMTTSTFPGWSHLSVVPAVYAATALITGVAAVVLVQAIRGRLDPDTLSLDSANVWLIGWWLVLAVVFLLTLMGRRDASTYLNDASLVAILAGIVLAGILPLILHAVRPIRLTSGRLAVSAALVLVGGLLLRYGIVMGPQLH